MMRKVRVIFYCKPFKSWTDAVIAGWTWLWNIGSIPASHVEIGFEAQEDGAWRYFSSSIRDGGTRWKWGTEILKNPERWDIYEDEYREDAVTRMIERAQSILGKKYDKLGILGFVTITGLLANKKDYWYCSEAVWWILTGLWKKRISPRRLYSKIKVNFEKVKEVK